MEMLDLAGRYALLAALYYVLVAYPGLKLLARRRRADAERLARRLAELSA